MKVIITSNAVDQLSRATLDDMVERLKRDLVTRRPVVTTCPICRRPNPCPLHQFGEQAAHYRARVR